jgi:hypothetical protein
MLLLPLALLAFFTFSLYFLFYTPSTLDRFRAL